MISDPRWPRISSRELLIADISNFWVAGVKLQDSVDAMQVFTIAVEVASDSHADAVAQAEVVLMCLPGGKEVEAVTRGPGGLLGLVRRGQTVVDMSTAPPRLMRELAPAFEAKGVDFADAPVARTRRAAVDGTLSIMFGGSEAVFARLKPILATMGTEIRLCGGVGARQVVKVMNSMVVFETTMANAEAISIAEAAGVDGRLLFETMPKASGWPRGSSSRCGLAASTYHSSVTRGEAAVYRAGSGRIVPGAGVASTPRSTCAHLSGIPALRSIRS